MLRSHGVVPQLVLPLVHPHLLVSLLAHCQLGLLLQNAVNLDAFKKGAAAPFFVFK